MTRSLSMCACHVFRLQTDYFRDKKLLKEVEDLKRSSQLASEHYKQLQASYDHLIQNGIPATEKSVVDTSSKGLGSITPVQLFSRRAKAMSGGASNDSTDTLALSKTSTLQNE